MLCVFPLLHWSLHPQKEKAPYPIAHPPDQPVPAEWGQSRTPYPSLSRVLFRASFISLFLRL